MDDRRRTFLESLLTTPAPSGYEADSQRVWVEYVREFADEVRTDDYGNAVATLYGNDTSVALAGHGDEIGFIVRDVTDDGFLRIERIGGSDKTVSRGQHVTVHTADGPLSGVVGQTAIHLRDPDDESVPEVAEQHVDVGAEDGDELEELVDRGDPVTFQQTLSELENGRLAARGMDNRIGIWAAAEGLRRAAERGVDATVHAVSTVQEEVGLQGAKMVGFDLDPDAVLAVDVTHATDAPDSPGKRSNGIELGGGPVVARGSANHPVVVEALREAGADEEVAVQLQAAGIRTGTDADAFFTARGGIPAANVGLPNRYMHTPVEVIDPEDLDGVADLLAGFAVRADDHAPFSVEV
ncbi:M20/M25/M40 family metallo-hydrolase [Haloarcula pellucida]|uniref:Endoglucanase n=1 Tax=Haloarcula pellucida TaxID=1427151 RepID=A0A830GI02_9EURY|nr:M20/M25/M40 family metallo-hydrolase [Halomicroarcula pellucida]MBX0347649.1 M42 family peptidase [Halomicroarcula pellucida]GGN89741.1 endoglucanase [Halomicroarcula pellucida]